MNRNEIGKANKDTVPTTVVGNEQQERDNNWIEKRRKSFVLFVAGQPHLRAVFAT